MATSDGTVIIGGGLAASHAAQTLREQGYSGSITLIADEATPPYERPPLSKEFLQGKQDAEAGVEHDAEWYAAHEVNLVLGGHASEIDRQRHVVRLDSGDEFPYGQLLLATGADSRHLDLPGTDLPGVMMLRRLGDAQILKDALAAGGRLAVVGAGWIGLEVAASARQAGMEVTVVAPNNTPLENVMGEKIGAHFAEVHRSNGVQLRLGTQVKGIIERDGRAAGLDTSDGEVPADVVLIAIGAVPATSLAEAAGLETDNGVLVDGSLRTSDPDILAAGDLANAVNTKLGRLRVEHWDNAIRQGELAAKTILKHADRYDWLPYFFTDQFDLGMEYVGHAGPGAQAVVRGSLDSGEFIAFWLEEGVVTAAMNVNIWDVNDTLRSIVGRTVAEERLADTGVELADL
ncbi:MAG: FAD-dependent oxidoreductase [Micrococcaceae bacterium]|uniref:NAD(P)/FAD-dependent oxidoreductase n=1 Tax=Arthrobacter sp. AOP36-C1-22 TaxID=3457683 RepID=UPI002650E747|nr:FAD-dependent oxidoreductase [Micrococcaceae bacterium]MDN5813122.1 FAD-dependent oxidoreductase [Micrococcaceae bacterium]MDN5878348.1 FAD-dependent oxidoreductase [Micrococcaceae bacterium]MDN5885937.1 FAD-dependent oxidoreductase [Micrococcaceae bacterium]MDN6202755.1 FAD-dependent oxidoreductase [Micrococcaceae bacterium]